MLDSALCAHSFVGDNDSVHARFDDRSTASSLSDTSTDIAPVVGGIGEHMRDAEIIWQRRPGAIERIFADIRG
jgi:hypothetical protein